MLTPGSRPWEVGQSHPPQGRYFVNDGRVRVYDEVRMTRETSDSVATTRYRENKIHTLRIDISCYEEVTLFLKIFPSEKRNRFFHVRAVARLLDL